MSILPLHFETLHWVFSHIVLNRIHHIKARRRTLFHLNVSFSFHYESLHSLVESSIYKYSTKYYFSTYSYIYHLGTSFDTPLPVISIKEYFEYLLTCYFLKTFNWNLTVCLLFLANTLQIDICDKDGFKLTQTLMRWKQIKSLFKTEFVLSYFWTNEYDKLILSHIKLLYFAIQIQSLSLYKSKNSISIMTLNFFLFSKDDSYLCLGETHYRCCLKGVLHP